MKRILSGLLVSTSIFAQPMSYSEVQATYQQIVKANHLPYTPPLTYKKTMEINGWTDLRVDKRGIYAHQIILSEGARMYGKGAVQFLLSHELGHAYYGVDEKQADLKGVQFANKAGLDSCAMKKYRLWVQKNFKDDNGQYFKASIRTKIWGRGC